jgi:hypothetical protein
MGASQQSLLMSSGASAGGPAFANVTLLLGFEDGNGATTFADASNSAFTVTGQSGAAVTTSQSKFGGGSLDIPGTTGAQRGEIAQATNSGFAFGSGNFCIECWARYISGQGTPTWHMLDANQTGTARFLLRYNASSLRFEFFLNGSSLFTPSYTWTSGNWVHVAVTRENATWRMFADGSQIGTATDSSTMNTGTTALYIGNSDNNDGFGGQFDEIRFVKGEAVYTASFTPPTAAFPRS